MQAARGASLTGDPDVTRPTPGRASRARLIALLGGVALVAYAADVVTKALAVDRLSGRPDVRVVGDLLVLHLVRNPGAAFSTGTAYTAVLSCISIAAILVILWFARRVGSVGWAVALGLLLAGVAGNLTDRLVRDPGPLRGHVVDFLMLPHWPVFNVADMCIDVAAVLILIQVYRGVRLGGGRTARRPDDAAGADLPGSARAPESPE